jgi:serine/threonine-protein kinase
MASKTTIARGGGATASGKIDGPSLVGMRLGDRYRLLELIGSGGMGGVFRAEQLATGRIVALKLLHPELAHIEYMARRFAREAKAASRLSHPNIVAILDYGELEGHLYLAMELLTGQSLTDCIARGDLGRGQETVSGRLRRFFRRRPPPLRVAHTVAIMRQVLTALEHAHKRGVVHRDLKPDNIMLLPSSDGSAPQVKLLDFGIAKVGDDAPTSSKLTQAGVPLGTPHYMSPEQAAGESTDARSDLYSCGVILYEMLTGRPPFDAPSMVQLLSMQVTATPEPLRAVAPLAEISEAVERVVLRALEKRPEDRFASAAALKKALERALSARPGDAPSDDDEVIDLRAYGRWAELRMRALIIGLGTLVLLEHHWPFRHHGEHGHAPAAASAKHAKPHLR